MKQEVTPTSSCVVDAVSRMLEPDQRDAVRGDLAESSTGAGQTLWEVLGLIARQQAQLLLDSRSWLVLVGMILPLGLWLGFLSRHVADGSAISLWLYANNWHTADLANDLFRHQILHGIVSIAAGYLTLFGWSWISALVIGYHSHRVLWMNGSVFCLALLCGERWASPQFHNLWHEAVFSLAFYDRIFPVLVWTVLALLPSLAGMIHGRRWRNKTVLA